LKGFIGSSLRLVSHLSTFGIFPLHILGVSMQKFIELVVKFLKTSLSS
jgi:hypothetical protein